MRDVGTEVPEQPQPHHNGCDVRYQNESGLTLLSYEVDPYDYLTRRIRVAYPLGAGMSRHGCLALRGTIGKGIEYDN